ncbi:hypothetical protein [Nocardia brevicatena]|uniref:hypothetical protein n=1 Tax=Nocardia brevicatena TaxID=37327 RepID=UPI0012F76BF4|nr:hypothetical protein [Nocardia brevicatena]
MSDSAAKIGALFEEDRGNLLDRQTSAPGRLGTVGGIAGRSGYHGDDSTRRFVPHFDTTATLIRTPTQQLRRLRVIHSRG